MTTPSFDQVADLLLDIRDDLTPEEVTPDALPVDDLGLDSLDLIQLARQLRKQYQVDMFIETWPWKTEPLGTIVDHLLPVA